MTFPTRFPYMTLLGLVLAIAASLGILQAWKRFGATPLQGFYLNQYVRSFVPVPKVQNYFVAVDEIVVLEPHPVKEMHAYFDGQIFDHGRVLKYPAIACGVCLFLGLVVGSILDGRRRAALMRGVQVDGRRIVTPEEFNKRAGKNSFVLRLE